MSDRIAISAESRSVTGKKVKDLRKAGIIPAVIYGQSEPVIIQLENVPLRRALRITGSTQLLTLEMKEGDRTVIAREIQQHLTRGDLIHVDFYEVDMKQTITSEAALVAVGMAIPEGASLGVGTLSLRSVDIECLPDALVSEIEVDMTLITAPDVVLSVADLTIPEGVTILTDPETVMARFEYAMEEEEEEEEEIEFDPAADSVEVITKEKEEEDF
ncbi:MAG: 50S ribosomal protein L25 [Chloroflexi bacterium]|nr:50S ribosomal protein L25 [Chloroflexota bacterium]